MKIVKIIVGIFCLISAITCTILLTMTVHNLSRPHHIVRLHKDGEIINVVRGTALMYDSASNDYFIKNISDLLTEYTKKQLEYLRKGKRDSAAMFHQRFCDLMEKENFGK